ncbi:MAG: RimK family alpha-L-glutamate ligase [Pirellulaceae bacterium]|nr:RimK family alpha-L-glutamate ligase [Pirellulaceae bacterium]
MTFRLGILGTASGHYMTDLQRAANELSIHVELLSFPELSARIQPGHDGNSLGPQVAIPAPSLDAVLVRGMPLGSLEQVIFRMDCLQIWQSQGTPVVNSPRCLETSIDKWLTLHRLHLAGLRVPATVACQTRDQALQAFEELGRDVLVKPLFGGEGRGIIRLQDADLAWRTFSTLQQLGQILYIQQFLPHLGYDIRVLCIGNQMYSIRRQARLDDYRTNVSRGGIAQRHKLDDLQIEMARQATTAVDGTVVGVDLLPAQDGKVYVLEVNAVPGWRGLARCLGVDIAKRIIQELQQPASVKPRVAPLLESQG